MSRNPARSFIYGSDGSDDPDVAGKTMQPADANTGPTTPSLSPPQLPPHVMRLLENPDNPGFEKQLQQLLRTYMQHPDVLRAHVQTFFPKAMNFLRNKKLKRFAKELLGVMYDKKMLDVSHDQMIRAFSNDNNATVAAKAARFLDVIHRPLVTDGRVRFAQDI